MNDADITIRLATAADAQCLAEMRYQFRAAIAPVNEDEAEFTARCRAWMQTRLGTTDKWYCWVAESAHTIIGHLWLQLIEKIPNPIAEPEFHAYITNVYVLPDARGQGIGTDLLQTALNWSRARDVQTVILWPTPQSRSLYLRHDFAVSDDVLASQLMSATPDQ